MSRWIIDDFGNTLPEGSILLSQTLGVNAAESGVAEYAIQNLGFIAVSVHETQLHVRLRPSVVSARALSELSYWLLDRQRLPVTVSWFDQIWQLERTADARAAISFVSYVLELRNLQHADTGPRIKHQPSRHAAQKWRDVEPQIMRHAAMQTGDASVDVLLDRLFHGRWSLFDVDTAADTVQPARRGAGYPPLHPSFSNRGPLRGLESVADEQYRIWLHSCYLDVAINGRPRFDDIDAIITWPRFGDMRTRYWRLLIPLSRSTGLCRILSASGNDSGIDLRPQHIEEPCNVLRSIVGGHP